MKSSTRLDSVIFQLTPTRTRCDLIIIANEKKEKIASGLLNPFLAHLRAAQDQIARGGYSILLQPEAGIDATWFTKGTVERFVRFVSTPEILERVYTIESEILQIEEAITIQGCNDNGLSSIEDLRGKSSDSSEGTKVVPGANEEKAIVLYEPGAHLHETNGLIKPEGNSRVQLLKVLETRKTMLQKEQGMAFARAVAASFDIDHMAVLVSFAECFGASRLLDACLRFMELWKRKHETGQWLEIEAEAMSSRSDFSAMNASGIMLASVAEGHKNIHSHIGSEAGGKAAIDANADEVPSVDRHVPLGQQEYFQGQFPHPIFPAWPMQSPPGALPVYQAYPLQGMPYYQNCSGNGPFYQSSYPPMDSSQSSVGHKTSQDRGSYSEFEMHEVEKDVSRKKVGRSGKKKQGTVVIRNINYITSKAKSSGSASESFSGSETDIEIEGGEANAMDMIHKSTSKSSKRKGDLANAMDDSLLYEKEETNKGKETGPWQAFEDSLLRGAEESNRSTNEGMFLSEKDGQWKRHQNAVGDDALALGVRDTLDIQDGRTTEHQAVNGMHRMLRASNDEASISTGQSQYGAGRGATEDQIDMHFMETNGRKVVHRTRNDDFIIGGRENRSDLRNLSYPLTLNGSDHVSNDLSSSLLHGTSDESFLVPFRSMSIDQSGIDDRTAIDMDYELPLALHKSENVSDRIISQVSCEPDDLSLMPERGAERRTIGYDPALDYETEVCIQDTTTMNRNNGELVTDVKQASVKSDKVRKSKLIPDILDKKRVGGGPIRKGKPSKISPIEDARARAEKLRIYKADLRKMKKEKEEVELNRLEALKMERQKRIAARGSTTSSQSSSMEPRKQLPTKLSPVSHRGSKFSDSEPGSSLPLERSKTRTSLVGSNGSQNVTKAIKSSHGIHLSENRLSRSVSSLSETNKESIGVTPDSKASMSRIRRLSEPRSSMSPAISVKVQSTEPGLKTKVSGVSKPKASYGPERKKISAIINLDKSKAETLPELKIKTSKRSSSLDLSKSAQTELKKVNGNQSSLVSKYSEMNVNDDMSHPIDVDDNPVIEKTVVLECEKPSIPVVHPSEERTGERKEHHGSHEMEEKIAEVAEYSAIRAPPSPIDGVDIIPCQVQEQSNSNEVMTDNKEKGSPMISSAHATEKSYQAPYARVSSLEDPCTVNSEYGKALQNNLQMVPRGGGEIDKAHVSDFKCQIPEKIPENLEKSHVKESSKGFKRLLKFGRKNQSSSAVDQSRESVLAGFDSSEQDETTKNASPSEVHTLKNLISEDETPTSGNTSQKASRHFSLFSPFRSKASEKK